MDLPELPLLPCLFQNLRLGPVPGPHLRRGLPAHRPDRAQLRTAAIRSAMAGLTVPPDTGVGPGAAADVAGISDPDLRIPLGGAPLPAHGGQPRPPSIPVIALTAAETARLARLAAWTAGHLDRASLAFHLRWSKWRRRHQATARWHHYATRLQALAA